MNTALKCDNLCKNYNGFQALINVNLELNRGRIVGLLGPNGSGKTTLIKLINGLLTPSSGNIQIAGNPVGVESKKIVSYLPDKTYLPLNQTVEQVIAFFMNFYQDFDRKKAGTMLRNLSIEPSMKLKNMSKGTLEKVQLILVMSRQAQLYVLDEPIAGVDPAAREFILRTIIQNYSENATVLISTHLISDIEPVLDDVLFLKNGSIVLNSTVDEIREQNNMSVDGLFREVFRC